MRLSNKNPAFVHPSGGKSPGPACRVPGRTGSPARGFTLPAVLVVMGALLILAVGILLVVGIERDTARSFVDRQRADLAARAGVEELQSLLLTEAANDDYLVLQSSRAAPITAGADPAPHLFLARAVPGTAPDANGRFTYRYIPLFSSKQRPPDEPFAEPEGPISSSARARRIRSISPPCPTMTRCAHPGCR